MVVRVVVECFPHIAHPEKPKDGEPPSRQAVFQFGEELLTTIEGRDVALRLFVTAVRSAVQGVEGKRQRLIYPIDGTEDVVPPFDPSAGGESPEGGE